MTIDRSSRRSPRACHGRLVPVGWSLRHAVALAPAPRRSPLDPPAAPSGSTCHRRPERAAGRLPRSLQQSPIQSLPRTAGPERARTGGPNNPAPTVPHHQVDQRRRPHQRVPNCSLTGHDTVSGTHTLDRPTQQLVMMVVSCFGVGLTRNATSALSSPDGVSGRLDTGLNRCDHEGGCVSPRRVPCPPWSVLLSNLRVACVAKRGRRWTHRARQRT
jgi:hypothetical protein